MELQAKILALAGFSVVAAGFVLIAFLEVRQARSSADLPDDRRLLTNFGLGVVNSILALTLPFSTATAALFADSRGWGIMNHVALPVALGFLLVLLARSLAMYGFHRASHAMPWLWRFHRVHHSDPAFDLSTAFRSHPVEVVFATPVAASVVLLTGAPLAMVIAVDATLLLIGMWEHGDLQAPRLERLVGLVVATPSQHRLHHSPLRKRHDRNFGDTLILWDRIFGTYSRPDGGRPAVGIDGADSQDGILRQLTAPFSS